MLLESTFYPVRSRWTDARTYLFVLLFAAGNLILPQLIHGIPSGGKIFLPIYFFTLIAAYKFGLKVGLTTAILSPILNSELFGMPPTSALPIILIKSCLLALIASSVSTSYKKLSLLYIAAVIIGYQFVGSLVEWSITQSFAAATADVTIGIRGMLVQLFVGWALLKSVAKYEQR